MSLWSNEEFTDRLQQVGSQRYHDKHPFHRLMNEGRLERDQLRLWVANRFYYQKKIPIKDAILLSRCPVREVRRHWIQRIVDHDGSDSDIGGIERWLCLGDAVGLARDDLEADRLLLPGVRFAVDSYVTFVSTRPWIEGVASSLTELFAPSLMVERLAAFEKHYGWIGAEGLAYFRGRPPLASRDSQHGLTLVLQHCVSREQQERAVAALQFKCDMLWSMLDAIYNHCGDTLRL